MANKTEIQHRFIMVELARKSQLNDVKKRREKERKKEGNREDTIRRHQQPVVRQVFRSQKMEKKRKERERKKKRGEREPYSYESRNDKAWHQ